MTPPAQTDSEAVRRRAEVIERLCLLLCKVNEEHFRWSVASDCICDPSTSGLPFRFDPDVLEFVERAVDAALFLPAGRFEMTDERMDGVRWTITGEDAFKAKAYVWDGPVLARGERVLVAPAAALERAEERLRAVEEIARDAISALVVEESTTEQEFGVGYRNENYHEQSESLRDRLRAVLSSQEPSTDHTEEER